MIVVSGPPTYLAQISAAVTAFEEAQITNFVMKVFPLKYAWAEDMSVNSMDKTVTIPEWRASSGPWSRVRPIPRPGDAGHRHRGQAVRHGLIAQGRMTPWLRCPAPAAQQGGQAAPQNATQVNIMADPRVNAVLVNDAEYRMPYYAKVIADLDRPVELVEIHAAIVDIDSDFKRDLGVTYQGANSRTRAGAPEASFPAPETNFRLCPRWAPVRNGHEPVHHLYARRGLLLAASRRWRRKAKPGCSGGFGADSGQCAGTLENTSTYYIQVEGYQAVDLFKVEAGTVLRVTRTSSATNAAKPPSSSRSACRTTRTTARMRGQRQQRSAIKQTKINTQAIVGAGQSCSSAGTTTSRSPRMPAAYRSSCTSRARKPLQDDEQGDQTHGAPDPHYAEGHPFG